MFICLERSTPKSEKQVKNDPSKVGNSEFVLSSGWLYLNQITAVHRATNCWYQPNLGSSVAFLCERLAWHYFFKQVSKMAWCTSDLSCNLEVSAYQSLLFCSTTKRASDSDRSFFAPSLCDLLVVKYLQWMRNCKKKGITQPWPNTDAKHLKQNQLVYRTDHWKWYGSPTLGSVYIFIERS
jgi:hypothetical protein